MTLAVNAIAWHQFFFVMFALLTCGFAVGVLFSFPGVTVSSSVQLPSSFRPIEWSVIWKPYLTWSTTCSLALKRITVPCVPLSDRPVFG